jgi:hypothetical protein
MRKAMRSDRLFAVFDMAASYRGFMAAKVRPITLRDARRFAPSSSG